MDFQYPHLRSCTQRAEPSFPSWTNPVETHFGFPFQFELLYDRETSTNELDVPLLFFHVRSFDGYQRQSTEGYGFVRLPLLSGQQDLEVQLWKPQSSTADAMRAFFVGFGTELEDPLFLDVHHRDKILNKFGGRIQGVGRLRLKLQTLKLTQWVFKLIYMLT